MNPYEARMLARAIVAEQREADRVKARREAEAAMESVLRQLKWQSHQLEIERQQDEEATEHIDGVPWNEAPIPRKHHVCSVQTSQWRGLYQTLRCACGATADGVTDRKLGGGFHWHNRNSRREQEVA